MKKIKVFLTSIGEMIKTLWHSSKVMTLLLVFNNLIRNALWPLRALIVKNIIDIIVLANESGFAAYQQSLLINLIIFFVLFWLNRIWWPLNSYTQTLMLAKISHNTKLRISRAIERIHLSFFDYAENQDTYTRALAQADDRQPINTVNTVVGFISLIISLVTAFTIMIAINIPVTIILVLSSIPAVIWEGRFNKKIYDFDKEVTREKRVMGYLSSLFTAKTSAKEIRTFKMENYLSNKHELTLKEYNRKYLSLVNSRIRVDLLFWIILQFALMVGYFLIISDVAANIIAIGSLSYFLSVAVNLQLSIKNVGSSFNNVVQSSKYYDNLIRFESQNLNSEEEVLDHIELPKIIKSIEFDNVSFSYPNNEGGTIKDVSFILKNPQNAVLVGENGAGKTTLIKLLMGFYQPTSGRILLNGKNINNYKIDDYYKLFSVCFQDYMKYGLSLKDNIIMAYREMDTERLNKIYRETQLEEVIDRLPNKDETYLLREYDENGVEISGGQFNRIAIARAMAKDSPIVLFDEPNAALDAKAEQNLFKIYDELTKNKLGIMITHRLSTAVNSDVILVLKNGRLIEKGNHNELLKQNGEYAKLFNIQAKHYKTNEEVIV
jgi:ABC-type multidrug transport system fused ATPase/permease subunit